MFIDDIISYHHAGQRALPFLPDSFGLIFFGQQERRHGAV
jgi:hypothetical protein